MTIADGYIILLMAAFSKGFWMAGVDPGEIMFTLRNQGGGKWIWVSTVKLPS
jgi:hypothetical protein